MKHWRRIKKDAARREKAVKLYIKRRGYRRDIINLHDFCIVNVDPRANRYHYSWRDIRSAAISYMKYVEDKRSLWDEYNFIRRKNR